MATNDDGPLCYVCMESCEVGARLQCACTTSSIHAACLERLVNSRKLREKSIEERLTCSVCAQHYRANFGFYVLPEQIPTPLQRRLQDFEFLRRPFLASGSVVLFAIFILMIIRLSTLIAISIYAAIFIPIFIVLRTRRRWVARGQQEISEGPDFYDKAVGFARRQISNGRGVPRLEASEAPDLKRVVIVLDAFPVDFRTPDALVTVVAQHVEARAALMLATPAAAAPVATPAAPVESERRYSCESGDLTLAEMDSEACAREGAITAPPSSAGAI
ncbi:hypothetical protein T492DRAFT_834384 [Pavlovales sp. CCMP2436]|nr:hypothetical protein T492DRAFT_834384 [Pavlovales sp. CCMP2436]